MKNTSYPISKKRWSDLCRGRVTATAMTRWHPRAKEFRTVFVAKVGGVVLKTAKGTWFKKADTALKAGKTLQAWMKQRSQPN